MKKKSGLWLTAVLAAGMMLGGCGSEESGSTGGGASEESETFKVGMEAAYAPFNWTQGDDSNGAVKISGNAEYAGGYDVEIAKRIAEDMGKELEIVKTEWDGLVPALTSGKIDAIIAGMSPTAERKETIDFSDHYYTSELVMVVKKGGEYENATKLADFEGAKITAQLNTFHYTVIDQIEGVSKETAMESFPSMRVALESGMIDGYVSERPEAVSALQQMKTSRWWNSKTDLKHRKTIQRWPSDLKKEATSPKQSMKPWRAFPKKSARKSWIQQSRTNQLRNNEGVAPAAYTCGRLYFCLGGKQ